MEKKINRVIKISISVFIFVLMLQQDASAQAITANLTANGEESIFVRQGDLVTYNWSSSGGNSYNSAYMGAPQTGYNKNCATGKSVFNSASGTYSEYMTASHVGCIYVFMYSVYNSFTGKTVSDFASLVILPKGALLPTFSASTTDDNILPTVSSGALAVTLNNSKDLTVNTGESVRIAWKSGVVNPSILSLSYSGPSPRCSSGPFASNDAGGFYDLYMFSGYSGCTFTFTYRAFVGGSTILDRVILRVN